MDSPIPANPRVAVIVPAYGVAHLVAEALASLQAQMLREWEALVIDDGERDDVAGAVKPVLADPGSASSLPSIKAWPGRRWRWSSCWQAG